ncbi:MAG: DMT family transporter, partial [Rhodospirillales bacterium]|jgi:drug/metabolite transporter (DMT)-like permease|nr:DMT family transporter [Rhodospirillales bacterium]
LSLLAATFTTGTIVLAPFYGWETLVVRVVPADPVTVGAVVYLAVFPSVLAFFCYNRGVLAIGANRAAVFIHLVPVFGISMAIVFLGEVFSVAHLVGMGLIFAGVAIAARRIKA